MSEDESTVKPQDVRGERYIRMGSMNQSQRRFYVFLMERSAKGLWTTYPDCSQAGIAGAKKLVSLLCLNPKSGIKKRKVGKRFEFCV